jgi:hypothetical protein
MAVAQPDELLLPERAQLVIVHMPGYMVVNFGWDWHPGSDTMEPFTVGINF